MKNILKILGIIALAAAIGFPLVSCDNVDVNLLTLTGLKDYDGKYVVAFGANDEGLQLVAADVNANRNTIDGVLIKNGKALLNVWVIGGTKEDPTFTDYEGSDKMKFTVSIYDTATGIDDEDTKDEGWATVTFMKGVGSGNFSKTSGTSFDISVPSALVGTWVDNTNGTLVFTSSLISTPSAGTSNAYLFVTGIKEANKWLTPVKITSDGKISTVVGNVVSVQLYTWEISGNTLTIKKGSESSAFFTGTKQ